MITVNLFNLLGSLKSKTCISVFTRMGSTLIYRNCCWSHLLLFRRCLPTATRWLQDSKNSTIFVSTLRV